MRERLLKGERRNQEAVAGRRRAPSRDPPAQRRGEDGQPMAPVVVSDCRPRRRQPEHTKVPGLSSRSVQEPLPWTIVPSVQNITLVVRAEAASSDGITFESAAALAIQSSAASTSGDASTSMAMRSRPRKAMACSRGRVVDMKPVQRRRERRAPHLRSGASPWRAGHRATRLGVSKSTRRVSSRCPRAGVISPEPEPGPVVRAQARCAKHLSCWPSDDRWRNRQPRR